MKWASKAQPYACTCVSSAKEPLVDVKAVAPLQLPVEGVESDDRERTADSTARLILPPYRLHVSSGHLTRQ